MKVTDVVAKLDDFGKARAKHIENSDLIFHIRGNLDSVSQVESLIEFVDNIPTARLKITGKMNDGLVIVRIKCDRFSQIPPYLM